MDKKGISSEVKEFSGNKDCFLNRIPIELLNIITEIVEDETLKAETVGHQFKKQLLEWSSGDHVDNNNKRLVLLYKASRDGFSGEEFHALCNFKGETWTVIQDLKGYVFGGYTSIPWRGSIARVYDPVAYIFTFVNPHSIPPTKYKLTEDAEYKQRGIYDLKDYPPIFGGGHDLYIANQSNTNKNSFTLFPKSFIDTTGKGKTTFTGDLNFQTKEIEVWGTHPPPPLPH